MKSDEELIKMFVPLIRNLVSKGLSENFIKSCVRIGDMDRFTGGLKSDYVGHVRIDVNTVIKTHSSELELHKALMEEVNKNEKVFPEVLQLTKLDDGLYIMLMEELVKYDTFLKFIYDKNLSDKELEKLTTKALEKLSIIHNTETKNLNNLSVNSNPYYERIKGKINDVFKSDKELKQLKILKCKINNKEVLSVSEILKQLKNWLKKDLINNNLQLAHGDYHLANILFRPRGKGYSCLTIDPNPLIGVSDPIYDFGKLLHWIDIVGWAKHKPENCKSEYKLTKGNIEINYWLENEPKSVKHRRDAVYKLVINHLNKNSSALCGDWEKRLKISLASSHLGLAAIFNKPENTEVRRFIFARSIELLHEGISP